MGKGFRFKDSDLKYNPTKHLRKSYLRQTKKRQATIPSKISHPKINPPQSFDFSDLDWEEEGWARYFKQFNDLDGFDIDNIPGSKYVGCYRFTGKATTLHARLEATKPLAVFATKFYNKEHESDFEVLRVDKLNVGHHGLFLLNFMTFTAQEMKKEINGHDGDYEAAYVATFQALVGQYEDVIKVFLCRPTMMSIIVHRSGAAAGPSQINVCSGGDCHLEKLEAEGNNSI